VIGIFFFQLHLHKALQTLHGCQYVHFNTFVFIECVVSAMAVCCGKAI